MDNKICTIHAANWKNKIDKYIFYIRSNRFLQHMVRYLVGTMLEVSRGRISIKDFTILFSKDSQSKKILTAPSKGLYLFKVYYE